MAAFEGLREIHREPLSLLEGGQPREAAEYLSRLLKKRKITPIERAFLYFHLARAYGRLARFNEAERCLRLAISHCTPGAPEELVALYQEQALLWYRRNHLTRARRALARSALLLKGLERTAPFARYLHYRGLCFSKASLRVEAMESLKQSLALYRALELPAEQSQVLDTMGMIFTEMGQVEEALGHYQESLRLKEREGDEYGIAITLGNLGRCSLQNMEFRKAIDFFQKDLALCEKLQDSHGLMVMCNNLGRAFTSLKETGKASGYLERSLSMAREAGNEIWSAINEKDIAYNHLSSSELGEASGKLTGALETFRRFDARPLVAEALKIHAIVLRAEGRFEESMKRFHEALELYQGLSIPFQTAEVLFQIGLLYHRMNDKPQAVSYLEKAIEIAEKLNAQWLLQKFESLLAELHEGEWLRLCLKRYVGEDLVDTVLSETFQTGKRMRATVLFLDLKPGRLFFERALAEEVVSLFNDYFSRFSEIIARESGTVEGFIAQEMMAYFGVTGHSDDNALHAVRSGCRIMEASLQLAQARERRDLPVPGIAVGINTGEVYAGNVGTYLRMQFKVTGSTVNLASRILHKARAGQVLLSESAFCEVRDHVTANPLKPLVLKGVREEQPVWDVDWKSTIKWASP
ncbi:MAG: tetratricopeptide repeat protein [Candidatus Eremiobacteraeota bacterium]|nr:tetratricopeptide repeat protein [Candidatus Eremiobacteraeota bacterium]